MLPYVKNTIKNFFSFFLIAFSLYIFIALISYDINDNGFFNKSSNLNVNNLGGPLGASISDFLMTTIGYSSFLLLVTGVVWSIQSIFLNQESSRIKFTVRLISSLFLIACVCTILEFYLPGRAGGHVGELFLNSISNQIGIIGTLIFILIFSLPALSISLNFSWTKFLEIIGFCILYFYEFLVSFITKILNILKTSFSFMSSKLKKFNKLVEKSEKKKIINTNKKNNKDDSEVVQNEKNIKQVKQEPFKKEIVETTNNQEKPDIENKKFDMPSTQLLDKALDDGDSLSKDELNELAILLENKLEEFGVIAEVESVLPGPVVTRFEVQPAPGTKASKISNISQDIARSLSVSSVRVVEVIEGKSVVGVEIPNTNRKMVRLTEILSSNSFKNSSSKLSLALGHDIEGKSVVVDLAKMPHLLVAGTTGSGKSVGVNAMLLSLLFKSEPKDVRLILIDPKMLELSVYDGIPHLLTPVITDMTDASNGLRWCVVEMDRRYKLMSMMGVRNLQSFNKKIEEAEKNGKKLLNPLVENEEEYLEQLPSIVVVVDEFADMMMLVGKKVEHLIARIAQKARAAGIHLILATQRPSVDVITGLIKANIPTRIGFQVSSKIDSRTILDQGGAEQLLGYGDMLYLPPGVGVPVRVHGAFVGDDEVHRVVNDWKQRAQPDYVDEIINDNQNTGPIPGWSAQETGDDSDESDELYDEAVNFVIESRRASISAVQRKLRIGYNRAARLIETMESAGIVSEMSSNGSREVLVPKRN